MLGHLKSQSKETGDKMEGLCQKTEKEMNPGWVADNVQRGLDSKLLRNNKTHRCSSLLGATAAPLSA